MSDWRKTDYPGVRFREHPTRKHNGKKDRYYTVRFRLNGKLKEEPLGWASEGWTPAKANAEMVDRKRGKALVEYTAAPIPTRTPTSERTATQSPTLPQIGATFAQAANLFVQWAKTNKKTWTDDDQRLKKHVLPVFGKQDLNTVGFAEVEMLKTKCQLKGLAPATVVRCLAVTRSVFNFAIRLRMFSGTNPVTEVKFPKVNNKRLRFLTHDEARQLLDTAANHNTELHDMCLLCLYTGIRAGEMTALKWFDINFKHKLITIRDSKNGETRQVFMAENVAHMLKTRRSDASGSLVFPTHDGKQRVRVSKIFLRLVNQLGFNDGVDDARQRVCFHTLRHTFASWLALQGETLLTIKELMGHKTIEMTMRYAHLIPGQKRAAVDKLAEMASGRC